MNKIEEVMEEAVKDFIEQFDYDIDTNIEKIEKWLTSKLQEVYKQGRQDGQQEIIDLKIKQDKEEAHEATKLLDGFSHPPDCEMCNE